MSSRPRYPRLSRNGLLFIALGALGAGCIESMTVGVSPLAEVDASSTVEPDASLRDAGARDGGTRLDGGPRPVDAGAAGDSGGALADAAVRDAAARDAAGSDASARDAAVDAGAADTGAPDAGLERCEERLCAIAGISPRDTSCDNGQVSACLKDQESGQCSWYCL